MLFFFGLLCGLFLGVVATCVVLLPRIPYQAWPHQKKKEPNSP